MGEQGSGRDDPAASEDAAAAGNGTVSPTRDGAGAAPRSSVRFDDDLGGVAAAVRVRHAVPTIMNLLVVTVRLVACVFAAILLVRIGLAFVPVNPLNVIVEWIVRFADIIVWGFRDLFLPTDPRIGLVANYGLAAVFWLAVGMIAARVLSGLGLLVAGRGRS